jgi:hypothetical protein
MESIIQTVRPLINKVLSQIDIGHEIGYTDLIRYAPQVILSVEVLCGKVHLSSEQKKQLVVECFKRIIMMPGVTENLDAAVLKEFVDVELPALIDGSIWLANHTKLFKKSFSCRK